MGVEAIAALVIVPMAVMVFLGASHSAFMAPDEVILERSSAEASEAEPK